MAKFSKGGDYSPMGSYSKSQMYRRILEFCFKIGRLDLRESCLAFVCFGFSAGSLQQPARTRNGEENQRETPE